MQMCLRVSNSPHLPYLNLDQTRWNMNTTAIVAPQKAFYMISTWHRFKKLAFGWHTHFIQINMFIEVAISKYANKLVIYGHATSQNIFLVMVLERYKHLAAQNRRKILIIYLLFIFKGKSSTLAAILYDVIYLKLLKADRVSAIGFLK